MERKLSVLKKNNESSAGGFVKTKNAGLFTSSWNKFLNLKQKQSHVNHTITIVQTTCLLER